MTKNQQRGLRSIKAIKNHPKSKISIFRYTNDKFTSKQKEKRGSRTPPIISQNASQSSRDPSRPRRPPGDPPRPLQDPQGTPPRPSQDPSETLPAFPKNPQGPCPERPELNQSNSRIPEAPSLQPPSLQASSGLGGIREAQTI